ncbi:molybdopterin-dependent oxidoreductase [Anaerobacillus isosaccharinicus]|uniref:Dehydrogenase n=1 Tax=Anaerobacillus isosaccharinicus TaxID=1532552 RepID=A0A1S2M350_9BACI|nr:molybdopterin-dependent oxidoreductase [Anaerobacillus isosaccharinicus]MBA5588187.1 molybdopterin-dependent oxidoreductase [Anaerobacillus isosaccharinicus]QOY38360.1 molybdopterin-dependent oxidoreductase [Anaerobacillus isosaccharinicus]
MELNRRNFIKLSAVSGLFAAGATQAKPALTAFTETKASAATNTEGEWVGSTCQGCTTWCPVQVYVVNGRATKVRGNPNAKANHGEVCVRAHLSLQQVYDPDRVKQPMKRTNQNKGKDQDPQFVPITWEEAMDTIAEKILELRKNGESHKFSVWRGRYTANNEILYGSLAKMVGSPNNISHSSICAEAEKFGPYYTEALWGYRDYDHANCRYELLWGADPISSNRQVPHTINIWGNTMDRATIACIDPRLSATAAKADEWLPIIPGEDGALATAIAHVLLTEGLWYKPFVGDFVDGVNKFVAGRTVREEDFEEIEGYGVVKWWNLALKDTTPEWAAERCGIPVDQILRVARGFGEAAPHAISFLSPGASMQIRGGYTAIAVHALNGLVGSADNKGGTLSWSSVPSNGMPSFDDYLDDIAKKGAKEKRIDQGGTLKFPGLNKKSGGSKFTANMAQAMLDEDPYDLKVVLSYWNNFNFSCPDTNKWDKALAKLPFLVHMTVNPAEMTHFADIVLPVTHQLYERLSPVKGSGGNMHAHMTLTQRVIEPLWDVKIDETEIPFMLAEALAKKGFSNIYDYYTKEFVDPETGKRPTTPEEFNEIVTKIYSEPVWNPSIEKKGDNINGWEEFKKVAVWNSVPYQFKKKWGGNWGTDTGKFEFYSETLKRVLGEHAEANDASIDQVMEATLNTARGELAFVGHYEPAYRHGEETEFPFIFSEHRSRLNREARSANTSWYQEFKNADPGDVAWDDVAKINPIDAAKLGVNDGDKVKLTSPYGDITVTAKLWEGTRPGVISKCYGQGHWAYGRTASLDFGKKIARGGNNNTILADAYEALSGSTARHGGTTRIKVEKV